MKKYMSHFKRRFGIEKSLFGDHNADYEDCIDSNDIAIKRGLDKEYRIYFICDLAGAPDHAISCKGENGEDIDFESLSRDDRQKIVDKVVYEFAERNLLEE